MSCLLGIDLGTSSVKVVVFGVEGRLKAVGVAEYPTLTPHFGYAEQNPEDWWRATVTAVREALRKADYPEILGIGFSGQMHGLVLLDQKKNLVRPAIIWADQRSADLLPEIKERVGLDLPGQQCGSAPTAGFLIASLFWVQKCEAQLLERVETVILPKDFLRFKLTEGKINPAALIRLIVYQSADLCVAESKANHTSNRRSQCNLALSSAVPTPQRLSPAGVYSSSDSSG